MINILSRSAYLSDAQDTLLRDTPFYQAAIEARFATLVAQADRKTSDEIMFERAFRRLLKRAEKFKRIKRALAPNKGERVYSWDAWEAATPYALLDDDGDCEFTLELRGVDYEALCYANGATSVRETYFADHG